MAANAAAMPASGDSLDCGSTAISTSVPSQSCARRTAYRSSATRQRFLVDQQQPMYAFGHVPAGKRRTGDVADVSVDLHPVARALAVELCTPRRQPDRVAMRLPIGEHVERFDRAGCIEREGIGDQL